MEAGYIQVVYPSVSRSRGDGTGGWAEEEIGGGASVMTEPGSSLINKQTLELHYLVLQRGISARAWKAISNTLAFPPGMEAYK